MKKLTIGVSVLAIFALALTFSFNALANGDGRWKAGEIEVKNENNRVGFRHNDSR